MSHSDANNPDLILELLWEIKAADQADVPALEDKTIQAVKTATEDQLNSYFPDTNQIPLIAAADCGSIRVFTALLEAGADKKYYDEDSGSSLKNIVAGKHAFAKALKSTKALTKPLKAVFNFVGRNVIFSGRLMTMSIDEANQLTVEAGATVSDKVTGKNDVLVMGFNPDDKMEYPQLDKADEMKATIMNEAKFKEQVKGPK